MNIYQLDNLVQSFKGRTILDVDHLTIEQGSIVGLQGPNGAGKTTLLEILAFLAKPVSGRVLFQGIPVQFQEPVLQRLRQGVVMLDQYPILFSTTVYKNLEFGLKIRKLTKGERMKKIDQALDLVGMRSFRDVQAKTLSGGETQRVALARALALDPQVFLCDEPTASVDLENQATIVGILKRINREEGITVLFSTHDRQLAATLADSVIVLNNGRLSRTNYDNVFSCTTRTDSDNKVHCRVNSDFALILPAEGARLSDGRHRLRIDPEAVGIAEPETANVQNRFEGQVTQMMLEGEKVRVIVDVGFPLTVLLPFAVYSEQRPSVGQAVGITFDHEGVEIL